LTEATLNVLEMSCGQAVAAVEGELNKLSRVEHSNADFEKGTVEVSYDESRVTTGEIEDAIEEVAYTATAQ
jgi:copper chaperone